MLKLEGKKKVAIIGSAPSSVRLAPYTDPEWFIFGCSPGAYPVAGPHADAWMENHRWEPQIPGYVGTGQPWFTPEYCEFLVRMKGDVWMNTPVPPEIPNAREVPVRDLVQNHGPFFMTSSIAWMFAMALETPGVEEIGLFGVDMAANEEYGSQRAGCQFFIQRVMERGIKMTVPSESDLLQPSYWYGVTENKPIMIKATARRIELANQHQAAVNEEANARDRRNFFAGALDNHDYWTRTWVTTQSFLEPHEMPTGNEVRKRNLYGVHDNLDATNKAGEVIKTFKDGPYGKRHIGDMTALDVQETD